MGVDMSSANVPKPQKGPEPVADEIVQRGAMDLAAALALDAIDGDDRRAAARAVLPSEVDEARRVAVALAELTEEEPPADLRELVLSEARTRRAPGTPLAGSAPIGPSDAFRATVDALHRLLVDLRPDEWALPSLEQYGRVRDLIAHLVGVEENLLGLLGEGLPPDPSSFADHVRATSGHVQQCRAMPTAALLQRWVGAARRLAGAASIGAPDRPIAVNDVPTTIRGMFVLRTFEVWTHHQDVCRATGRSLPVLDGKRLRLMSSELIDALPAALTVTGRALPGRTMEIVLTGRGGATYRRPMALGSEVGPPDVTITADIVDFCRVASPRSRTSRCRSRRSFRTLRRRARCCGCLRTRLNDCRAANLPMAFDHEPDVSDWWDRSSARGR